MAEPVTINGDTVEYSVDGQKATAVGNVEVTYKDTKLTCEKLTVNMQTKETEAEGNVRLEDKKGIVEGAKAIYNFNTKQGIIFDSQFRANPYFGRAEKTRKVSDNELVALRGYATTCSYDNPHYRIKSRKMNVFPGDKIQTRDDTLYVSRIPLLYLPQYNHSLKDPLMHVQLMPGKSNDWGAYMLSAWRYNLAENLSGRIYLDYREKIGIAEGFGVNYKTPQFGKGDFKYYYSQERSRDFDEGVPAEFQRYFLRLRHKWNPDERTDLTSEYFKIVDSKRIVAGSQSILKDFFPREYEKDTQPLSYILLHRTFDYSNLDFLIQKRTSRWYSQAEKLPEIKYSLPSIQLGESPFYFENNSSYLNYNYKNGVPSDSWNDIAYNRLDTTNKLSLPTKMSFIKLTPSVSAQQIYYDKDVYGSTTNIIFSGGSDLNTKFYRIFNVNSNFLGLGLNGLRHIITPSASYTYALTSIMPSSYARFGGGASTGNGSATLELSNKLQTKRKGQSVDLANLKINTVYAVKPETGERRGSNFSDFLFDLELRPYSWMRIDADTTYLRSGNDDDSNANYKHFSNINYDVNFDFGNERSIGFGQRYQRKGANEITNSFDWRLSPKWKFSLHQRRNIGRVPGLNRGLREQEYRISRDLHCWTVDFTYNIKKGEGETVWLIFRLKAFPEVEFEYNKSYHAPKPGSQSNP